MSDGGYSNEEFRADLTAWMEKNFNLGKEPIAKNDWTLIVKLHAMIETALNGAILRDLNRPELSKVISTLDTSNGKTGKVAFAKALGILPKEAIVFIQKLSELRNLCVHDVRNFNFELIQHLTDIGEKERNAVLRAINKMVNPEKRISCPQEGLIVGTMGVVTYVMAHDLKCEGRQMQADLQRLHAERYVWLEESISKESSHPQTPDPQP